MADPQPSADETILEQFLNVGFVHLNQVIDQDTVNKFVDQIRDELAKTTNVEKERSVGRVELENQSTWPQKGGRRVVECAPTGIGVHWEKLKSSQKFCSALDEIVGLSCWELPLNKPRVANQRSPTPFLWSSSY